MVRPETQVGQPGSERRFRTRREKEAFQRRVLYIVTAIAAAVVAVTLIGGAIYQFILVPREVYATVNGVDIRRVDYEKRRTYDILQEITALSQQLQTAQQGQDAQIRQQLELLQLELQDLDNGDRNIDPDALKTMVEDQLVLQALDDFGIQISDDEIDEFINELLAPIPLNTPTPSPTFPPTPAAWATETAEAFAQEATASAEESATAAAETATAETTATEEDGEETTATPEDGEDEPTAEATVAETESAEETAEPDATETVDGTATEADDEEAEPTPTVEPTATLSREAAIETAEANFDLLDSNFLERADMSRGDFERLIARPALARQLIRQALASQVEPTQEQVRASHILVATREAAEELLAGRLQEEEFADVAAEVSTDTGTADNGGDLGWFPRGIMTDPFEEAAFSLEPGEMTQEPVQTEFGWHIILVTDREEDRPLTISMLNALRSAAFDNWLDEQFEEAEIDSEVPLPADDVPNTQLGVPGAGFP